MTDQKKYTTKLSSSHILIIGGSSGLGYSVAEASLEHGAHVTISSSQPSRIDTAITSLLKSYPSAKSRLSGHACDLSSPNVEKNIEELFEKAGKVDHIVYTAGDKLATLPVAEVTLENMQQAGMVRFFAPMLVAKVGRAYLSPGPTSSITLTTGSVSEKPMPGWAVVGSFASGLHAMTRGLALDLKPVRVNLISPGAVETELWKDMTREQFEGFKEASKSKNATGEIGQPDDVAESFIYAMKDRNLTGSIISTNGGVLLL
ncbi:MAG: hypothetical protein M1827_004755 [Pycnora praestabilis]|nr:MAG: hypothetical protein M1827_004755 [Pycnora praestabilis]